MKEILFSYCSWCSQNDPISWGGRSFKFCANATEDGTGVMFGACKTLQMSQYPLNLEILDATGSVYKPGANFPKRVFVSSSVNQVFCR